MTILNTARLRFEPFEPSHLDGLQAMNRDSAGVDGPPTRAPCFR
jgi:hypothetical protein